MAMIHRKFTCVLLSSALGLLISSASAQNVDPKSQINIVYSNYLPCSQYIPFGSSPDGGTSYGIGPANGTPSSGQGVCLGVYSTDWSPGWNRSGGLNGAINLAANGWDVQNGMIVQLTTRSGGIAQALNSAVYNYANGDSAGHYAYNFHTGGDPDAGGEGKVGASAQVYESGLELTGTVTGTYDSIHNILQTSYKCSPGSGQSCIASNNHPMLNVTPGRALATGHITQMTPPTLNTPGSLTIDTPVTASLLCTTSSLISVLSPASQTGVPVTVTVSCPSEPSDSQLYWFACDDSTEIVKGTHIGTSPNFQVTASFFGTHASGCPVYQGGPQGFLDLIGDQHVGNEYNGPGQMLRTAWEIVGANSATSLAYRYVLLGSQKSLPASTHNFGYTTGFNYVNRDTAGNVVACASSEADYTLPQLIGSSIIVSSVSDPSFNATVTATGFASQKSCVTWSTPSVTTAARALDVVVKMGGVNDNLGAFAVWPGAYVRQVLQDNNQVNGAFVLGPNLVSWNMNDDIEQAHGQGVYQSGFPLNNILNQSTPLSNAFSNSALGWGVSGPYFFSSCGNNTTPTAYLGHNGQLVGPTCFRASGLLDTILAVDYVPNSTILSVGSPVGPEPSNPLNGGPTTVDFTDSNSTYNLEVERMYGSPTANGSGSNTRRLDAYNGILTNCMYNLGNGSCSTQTTTSFQFDHDLTVPAVITGKAAPAASTDACIAGESWDATDSTGSTYHYYCKATSVILRVVLAGPF